MTRRRGHDYIHQGGCDPFIELLRRENMRKVWRSDKQRTRGGEEVTNMASDAAHLDLACGVRVHGDVSGARAKGGTPPRARLTRARAPPWPVLRGGTRPHRPPGGEEGGGGGGLHHVEQHHMV